MNRLDYLIDYLLKEDPQYSEMEIPLDLQGKRDLFRALRNVRWPKPISEEFLRLQDEELQSQLQEKGIVDLNKPSTFNSKPYNLARGYYPIKGRRHRQCGQQPNVGLFPSFAQMHRQCHPFRSGRAVTRGMLPTDAPTRSRRANGAGQNHEGL